MTCIQYIISLRAIAMEATFIQPLGKSARAREISCIKHMDKVFKTLSCCGNEIILAML